ncbi:MAG: hypothetical protein ACYCSQ_00280 [bacterium]
MGNLVDKLELIRTSLYNIDKDIFKQCGDSLVKIKSVLESINKLDIDINKNDIISNEIRHGKAFAEDAAETLEHFNLKIKKDLYKAAESIWRAEKTISEKNRKELNVKEGN